MIDILPLERPPLNLADKMPEGKATDWTIANTSSWFSVERDGSAVAVIGIAPITFTAQEAWLWMHVLRKVKLTVSEFKQGRTLIRRLVQSSVYRLLAFVGEGEDMNAHSLRFIGGKKLASKNGYIYYEVT